MNTMNNRDSRYGTTTSTTRNNAERESLLKNNHDEVEDLKNFSGSSAFISTRKAIALGALAFASVGALVVTTSSSGNNKIFGGASTQRLGLMNDQEKKDGNIVPHSFSELGKYSSSLAGGVNNRASKLGAMDIHAWPDAYQQTDNVQEESVEVPAVPERTDAYLQMQAQEQVVPQQQQIVVNQPIETANPQWVNPAVMKQQQQQQSQFGIPEAGVEIDPSTGSPYAVPNGGAAVSEQLERTTNMDMAKPPDSWPVDMQSGVQCNPIIGCVAGVPYPGIGCCETASLQPADVAQTQQQQQQQNVNPYQYPIAGAVTTQPAVALPYGQAGGQAQQSIYQQQQQYQYQPVVQQLQIPQVPQQLDPYAAYQQQMQAAPGGGAAVGIPTTTAAVQISPVGANGLPECNVADNCVAGIPVPGIGCCSESEKQIVIADAESRQQIDPVTGAKCNTDMNCVAGVPIPGIGCCEAAQAAVGTTEQTQYYYQQQQFPSAFAPGVNPYAQAVITAENAQPSLLNQVDPMTGLACNPNPGCVAGVPIPGISCCMGTSARMIPGAPLVDAATGLPLVNQNPVDPITGKPLFMKPCDATPTCVAGVPTPGVDSCCKSGECDASPTCVSGGLEPGVDNCCHKCDQNPECKVGSEFPGIDTCCKPPPPPDYDGTPGNCDKNPSCKPGVPDVGKNTCCPDNAACDTTPECVPGGTIPGVDTCCAETSLVKQKQQQLGSAESEQPKKAKNPWIGCNAAPSCLPGIDIPGVDNCCKNCEPGVPTPGVDDCAIAKKRIWARQMRKNGMKSDQIQEVIQKDDKHSELSAEEKEKERQEMMLELKNRIKEEMARKDALLKKKASMGSKAQTN